MLSSPLGIYKLALANIIIKDYCNTSPESTTVTVSVSSKISLLREIFLHGGTLPMAIQ